MKIENLFHYPELAVGLKPSASQGEARLRGLYRIIYSKTISPRPDEAKPACAGFGSLFKTISPRPDEAKPACAGESGVIAQQP